VTVRHEEIPGYMPAMTMPLRVLDAAALEDVQVGDRIEATLRVDPGKSALVDLVVTQPATMELSTAGGTLELRPKPPQLEPGEEVPDFQMTLQDGKTASLSSFRGKFVVLTFTYTRCPVPDFCPLIDRKFQELDRIVRRVPARAEAVRLLSVSFDPEHDTPEIIAKHAERVGATPPGWSFAVASHDELRKVAPVLGLGYGPGENEIMHNLRTAVIDPEGRLLVLENGNSWQPEKLIQAFQSLILPARK
jgi:protein SCO1/2